MFRFWFMIPSGSKQIVGDQVAQTFDHSVGAGIGCAMPSTDVVRMMSHSGRSSLPQMFVRATSFSNVTCRSRNLDPVSPTEILLMLQ